MVDISGDADRGLNTSTVSYMMTLLISSDNPSTNIPLWAVIYGLYILFSVSFSPIGTINSPRLQQLSDHFSATPDICVVPSLDTGPFYVTSYCRYVCTSFSGFLFYSPQYTWPAPFEDKPLLYDWGHSPYTFFRYIIWAGDIFFHRD